MIESTSSLRPTPTRYATTACPDSCVDRELLLRRVLDRLLEADFLCHLRLLHVVPVHRVAPAAQRPHQRLVEQVLDHHRAVAERDRRELRAALLLVEFGLVRLLFEVVVDDLPPTGTARKREVNRAIEAARPQQRGIEIRGTVRRADDQHVRG
jgi:hypothetical protein